MSLRTWAARRIASAVRFASVYAPDDDFWYRPAPGSVAGAGIQVDETVATKLTTLNACRRLLSGSIGMLPVGVYERTGKNGERAMARDHNAFRILHERPNDYQTPYEFMEETVDNLAARGNALAEKYSSRRNPIEGLRPIQWDHVRTDWWNRKAGRQKIYDISSAHDGRARVLDSNDVWHPRLRSIDGGLTGASPIRLNAEGIGLALAGQLYIGGFFKNGARIAGFIAAGEGVTKGQRDEVRKDLDEKYGGAAKAHGIPVYGANLTFHKVGVSPQDAQLVEMMDLGVADIARIHGTPLWLLQHERNTAWGRGLEQLGKGYDIYTLQPITTSLEQSLAHVLIDDPRRFFIELKMDALLRADLKARYESYRAAVNANNPWLKRNDIRRLEGMDPDESAEGEKFLVPENNLGKKTNEEEGAQAMERAVGHALAFLKQANGAANGAHATNGETSHGA